MTTILDIKEFQMLSISGAVAFTVMLGAIATAAMVLYFGLRAVKLI